MSADVPVEGPPEPDRPDQPAGPPDRSVLDEALDRARGAARGRGLAPRRKPGRSSGGRARPGGLSGSGPDERDPQPIGRLVAAVSGEQDWAGGLSEGAIAGRWEDLVGAEVASHCRPQRLDGGELHLVAESTAWATQLRLLAPQLVRRLADQLGPNVVRRVQVTGPTSPSWRRGPWRVAGRGPRDTYG